MTTYTIANAANVPLNIQTGSIPNLQTALLDWFQYLTFGQITKTTTGYQVKEVVTDINFWGVVMPMGGRELLIKPEGERQWNWSQVYAQASPAGAMLALKPDDVITFLGTQYRIMTRIEYALYGWVNYQMVEDYIASGPPTP